MRDCKSFDATLGEVGRDTGATSETPNPAPRVHALPSSVEDDAGAGGGAYLWDRASRWVPEPDPPETAIEAPSPPPEPPPSGDLVDIAAELALAGATTPDELNRSRRRFSWENHPDRHPDWPERLANRRVAIANMLIDRALENLARSRRTR
jgi:hypothetical protein